MPEKFTVDEYGHLDPMTQLDGKTIKSIERCPRAEWLITFTDGSQIQLDTQYEGGVQFENVDRH